MIIVGVVKLQKKLACLFRPLVTMYFCNFEELRQKVWPKGQNTGLCSSSFVRLAVILDLEKLFFEPTESIFFTLIGISRVVNGQTSTGPNPKSDFKPKQVPKKL